LKTIKLFFSKRKILSILACFVALALMFSVIQISLALNGDGDGDGTQIPEFTVSMSNGDFSSGFQNWEGSNNQLASVYGEIVSEGVDEKYFNLTIDQAWVGVNQKFTVTGLKNGQMVFCTYDYLRKNASDTFRVDIDWSTTGASGSGESTGNILIEDKYGLREGWTASRTNYASISGIDGEYGTAEITVSIRASKNNNADDIYFDNIQFYIYDESSSPCFYDINMEKINPFTLLPYNGTEEKGIYTSYPEDNRYNLFQLHSDSIQNLDFSQGFKYWGPIKTAGFASDYATIGTDGSLTVSSSTEGDGIGTMHMKLGTDFESKAIEGNVAILYKFKSSGNSFIDFFTENGNARGNMYAVEDWTYAVSNTVNVAASSEVRFRFVVAQSSAVTFSVDDLTIVYLNDDGTFTDVYTGTLYNADGTPTGSNPGGGEGGDQGGGNQGGGDQGGGDQGGGNQGGGDQGGGDQGGGDQGGGDQGGGETPVPTVNNELLNADFSNGLAHWESVSGNIADNAVVKSDSANGKYISIISKTAWTGVKQAFKVKGLKNGQKIAVAFDYKKNNTNDALRVDLNLVTNGESAAISEGRGNITFPSKVGLHKGWTASMSEVAKLNNITANAETVLEVTVRAAADNSGQGIFVDNIAILIYDDSLKVNNVTYPCYYTLDGTKLNVNTLSPYDGTSADGIYISQTDNNGFNYFSLYNSKIQNLDFSKGFKYWAYVTSNPTKSETFGYASKVAKINSDGSVSVTSKNGGDGIGQMWMNAGRDSNGNPVNGTIAIAYQYISTGNGNVEVHSDGFKGVSRIIGNVEKSDIWQLQISPTGVLEASDTNTFHVRISAADGGVTIRVKNIALVYANSDGTYTDIYTGKKYSTDVNSGGSNAGGDSGNSGSSSGGSSSGGGSTVVAHIGTEKDGIFNESDDNLGNKFPIRKGFMNGDFSQGLKYWLGNKTGYTSLVATLKTENGNKYVSMAIDETNGRPAMITQTNFLLEDVAPGTEIFALMNYRGDSNIEFGGYTCNAIEGKYPLTRISGVQVVYEPATANEWGIAMSAAPITIPDPSQIDITADELWGTNFGGKIALRLCITINGKTDLDNVRFVKKLADGTLVELNGTKVDLTTGGGGAGGAGGSAIPDDFDWNLTWGSEDENSNVGAGAEDFEAPLADENDNEKGNATMIIIIVAAAVVVLLGAGALYFFVIRKKLAKNK